MSEPTPDQNASASTATPTAGARAGAKQAWWKKVADAYRRRPLLYGFFTLLGLTVLAAVASPLLSSRENNLRGSFGKEETTTARLRSIADSLRRMDEFGQMAYAELLRDSLNPWMRQLKPPGWRPDEYLYQIFPQFQQAADERAQLTALIAEKQQKLSDKDAATRMPLEVLQKEAASRDELQKKLLAHDANVSGVRARLTEELSSLTFSLEDAFIIEGTAWMRDISARLRERLAARSRGAVDSLALAQELFDWTVRNVALDEREEGSELLWESLLWGRGPSSTRAWIFIELCRQQGLDAVMLGYRDPKDPGDKQQVKFQYWAPAVVVSRGDAPSELYLFDHRWGIPIPGPGGKGVATLTQAAASPDVLRQLDSALRAYPVRSGDLQEVVALLDVTPHLASRRMQVLESELRGADRMVLTVALSSLATRLEKIKGISRVQAWPWPIQCELASRNASPQARSNRFRLLAMKGVEEKGQKNETLRNDPQFRDLTYGEPQSADDQTGISLEADKRRKLQQDVTGFLWRGRMLHFRGVFADTVFADTVFADPGSGQQAAAPESSAATARKGAPNVYQSGRFTDRDLDELRQSLEKDIKTLESQRQGSEQNRLDRETVERALAGLQRQLRQMPITRLDRQFVRLIATGWVGQVAYERGDYGDAAAYFRHLLAEEEPALTKTIDTLKDQLPAEVEKDLRPYLDEVVKPMLAISKANANYNLARALEAAGQYAEAIDAYNEDRSADQRPGSLYRARRLEEQLKSQTKQGAPAKQAEKPAAAPDAPKPSGGKQPPDAKTKA